MKGDKEHGDVDFADARKRFVTSLAKCDAKVTDPIKDAEKKMDNLISRKDWDDIEDLEDLGAVTAVALEQEIALDVLGDIISNSCIR